jgi:pantoate--beta-alanine ligase
MDIYTTVAGMRAVLDPARSVGRRVGMVGTSGAMHRGHLSLIEQSAAENDITVLYWGGSAAFGWMSSQIDYQRDSDRDFRLAEQAGSDLIFAPTNEEFFPREPMTKVSLPAMSSGVRHLEDPAHLDLIALCMCRIWNMCGPCRSYFGAKDWQQLAMFKRMADDLYYPVDVIGCPTIREESGLAVSSRNSKLSKDQLAIAPCLYRALQVCLDAVGAGERQASELDRRFATAIEAPSRVVYFTVVEAQTMAPLEQLRGSMRLLASIELGSVRLLDNVGLDIPE